MSQSLFRQQAVEQQGERLWGELFISQPVSFSLLTLLLAFFTCSALWYLWNNDYRRSQEVSGYLVPDRGMVDISPPRDGLLLDIQVREGDAVAAGQLLFSVQSDMVISDNKPVSVEMLQELQFQRRQLLARIALENDSLQLNHEHHAVIEQKLGNEIQQLNGLLVREAQLLEMREKAFWRSAALRDKGMIADAELEVVKTRLLEQENILDNLSLKINTAKSLIKENEAGNKAARLAVAKEILKINDGISELDKQIARYEVENRNHVYATVAGNVGALGASQGQLV
ncbi:MAG: hypothetical protein WD601_00875, partial [Pseudohongiellaceae bacterium]